MSDYAKTLAYVRHAGFDVAYAPDLYRPGGYPRLRLAPLHETLSQRSTGLLGRQLVLADQRRGHRLVVRGISHLDPRLANELGSVYLGLAEMYPGVYVGGIHFHSGSWSSSYAAEARTYDVHWPLLHARFLEIGSGSVTDIARTFTPASHATRDALQEELRYLGAFRSSFDLSAHGIIHLANWTARPRAYAALASVAPARNKFMAPYNNHRAYVPTHVTEAAATLVHEFGHVVESAVLGLGPAAEEHVYDALERCLLRRGNGHYVITADQLRASRLTREETRLVNYPKSYRGRLETNTRTVVKDVVGKVIREAVNGYSAKNRDELFAECFFVAHTARDEDLRARLRPFLDALYDVGLARRRRYVPGSTTCTS